MGHKYRDWIDELVSLRIENAKLQEQLDYCRRQELFERTMAFEREKLRAAAEHHPEAVTALALAARESMERAKQQQKSGALSAADVADHASIWGESEPSPPYQSPKQDPLDELVSLRLNNERLLKDLSFYRHLLHSGGDLYAGVSHSQPSSTHSQSAGMLGSTRAPAQLPAAPRRLGSKREGFD